MMLFTALLMFITGLVNGENIWLLMSVLFVIADEIKELRKEIKKRNELAALSIVGNELGKGE